MAPIAVITGGGRGIGVEVESFFAIVDRELGPVASYVTGALLDVSGGR